MSRHTSSTSNRLVLLMACAVAASMAIPGVSNAATGRKPYAATVTPSVGVAAGATASFTLTLKNDSPPQPLGSANLSVAVNHDPSVSTALMSSLVPKYAGILCLRVACIGPKADFRDSQTKPGSGPR